ncbi:MAG: PspA/IM30 family protein [Alphaproteobacteria bacterium]|nr:PspA/IM30 family protein [Alphaproteobacteria bacterium]
MGLISKIFTAFRGGAREVGEAIVDKNSIRIFEQEIADAENHMEKAKRDLTEVMAKEMEASRKIKSLNSEIEKHEGYASQALKKNDENLALEIAEKIVELTIELELQKSIQVKFAEHSIRLKAMVKKTGKSIADMKRQLVMVKTTDSVQKAASSINHNYASGSSKLLTAKESLDRIQKRQAEHEDRLKAGEALENEESGADLEAKMKAAGIGETNSSASDVLAKLKAKRS